MIRSNIAPKQMLWIITLCCVAWLIGCSVDNVEEQSSPNIIYILADDLGYGDIEPFGQQRIKTPNLNRLAQEGKRFVNHYSGSTVCAPSRSVLMTGLHTGHSPIRGNKEHFPIGQHPMPDSVTTVAEVLKEAGYATGAFGKWALGYPGSNGAPSKQGFDYFFGYNGHRRAHFYYPEFLFKEVAGQEPVRVPLEGNKVYETSKPGFPHPGSGPPIKRGTYSQDIIVDEALTFIDQNAKNDEPFFAYLPLTLPHASLTVPKSALELYLDADGNSIFEEKPFRGDHYTKQSMPRATYAAMITLLDSYVGKIVNKLEEQEIADNTIVIFTSDNGPHAEGGYAPSFFDSNGPLRGIKRDLYEGGIRVPMIAWWPGTIKAGTSTDHISAFEDMLPTFADLAGTRGPQNMDGISMVPTLLGEGNQKKREYLYWEFSVLGGKQAVRKGKWKAVRLEVKKNPDGPIQLYNLEKDISEQHNVATDHPDIVKEMDSIMHEVRKPSHVFPLFKRSK